MRVGLSFFFNSPDQAVRYDETMKQLGVRVKSE